MRLAALISLLLAPPAAAQLAIDRDTASAIIEHVWTDLSCGDFLDDTANADTDDAAYLQLMAALTYLEAAAQGAQVDTGKTRMFIMLACMSKRDAGFSDTVLQIVRPR
ncbi:MAG: hypothetical protein CMH12_03230 [Maritimibacter sp.]|nr:hypothetical protein [Maritimibacter sp.]|tara:strand:- start:53 stop:376 length:324 start_codon:yes stop_codon:yes gene_type:complete